ncbi:MAG: hypothetical protein JO100_13010 [Pseudonocardia sp.]|nr:hypothetical protein [Pseudonocardia sp.]
MLCPVEIISRSSRCRDRINKSAVCAGLGIPYFLHVEIRANEVLVEMLRLDLDGAQKPARYASQVKALSGQKSEVIEPFPISFDPVELLES